MRETAERIQELERQRQRETERDRERDRERETDRDSQRETVRQKDDFWLGAGLNNLEVRADSHRGREERKGARGEERERAWALFVLFCCFASCARPQVGSTTPTGGSP
jgi:hypothetical protein